MKIIATRCPACNANLELKEGQKQYFCSYCGTPITIEDDREHTVKKITRNETKIETAKAEADRAKVEAEERIRKAQIRAEKEKQQQRHNTIQFAILGVLIAVIYIGLFLIKLLE